MTHDQAVQMAIAKFAEVCKAEMTFWMHGGKEPDRRDYGFVHGWFQIEGHSIGAHEYALGPYYNGD